MVGLFVAILGLGVVVAFTGGPGSPSAAPGLGPVASTPHPIDETPNLASNPTARATAPSAQSRTNPPGSGAWLTKTFTDDNGDGVSGAVLSSVEGDSLGERFVLVIQCAQSTMHELVSWHRSVGNATEIWIRYDGSPPEKILGVPASDGMATWFGLDEDATTLVRRLIGTERLEVTIEGPIGPITGVFDTTGAREVLEPIIAACGS